MKWSQDDKDTGDYCHGNAIVKIFVGPGSAFMQHVSHPQLLGKSWADAMNEVQQTQGLIHVTYRHSKVRGHLEGGII